MCIEDHWVTLNNKAVVKDTEEDLVLAPKRLLAVVLGKEATDCPWAENLPQQKGQG